MYKKLIPLIPILVLLLSSCGGDSPADKVSDLNEAFKEKIETPYWDDTVWSNVINDMSKFDQLMNRPQIQTLMNAEFTSDWETCPNSEIYPFLLLDKNDKYSAYLYTIAFMEMDGEDQNMCSLYLVLGTYDKDGKKVSDLILNNFITNGSPVKFLYHSVIKNKKTIEQDITEYKTKESDEEEDVIDNVSKLVFEINENGKIVKKSGKRYENRASENLVLINPLQDYPSDVLETDKPLEYNIRYYFMKMADSMNLNPLLEKEIQGSIGGFSAGFSPLKTDKGELRYTLVVKTGGGYMYGSFDPMSIVGINTDNYFPNPVAAFYYNIDLDSDQELVVIQKQELNGAQGIWNNYSVMIFKVKEDRLLFVKDLSDALTAKTAKGKKDTDNAVFDEESFKSVISALQ